MNIYGLNIDAAGVIEYARFVAKKYAPADRPDLFFRLRMRLYALEVELQEETGPGVPITAKEITEKGYYWWTCPPGEGPRQYQGATVLLHAGMIVGNESVLNSALMIGDPSTYVLRNLPGEFRGPLRPETLRQTQKESQQ